jgi:hypothetical protein
LPQEVLGALARAQGQGLLAMQNYLLLASCLRLVPYKGP